MSEQKDYGAMESSLPNGANRSSTQSGSLIPKSPPQVLVHVALLLAFAIAGGGALVAKFGIHGTSPFTFEALREVFAGPTFLLFARATGRRVFPDAHDGLKALMICGLFAPAQVCFYLGLSRESPTVGSTWAVALPITTTAFAVFLGAEQISFRKVAGIVLASSGAMWMALGDSSAGPSFEDRSWASRLSGHACFFGQCVLNSIYFNLSKPVAHKYGSIFVVGWGFTLGSVTFSVLIAAQKWSEGLSMFVCQDPNAEITLACMDSILRLPVSIIWPMLYCVVMSSFVGWNMLSWCLAHAKASTVTIYTVFQPVTACVLSLIAIGLKGRDWASLYGISMPGLHDVFGVILIGAGLSAVFSEDTAAEAEVAPEEKQIVGSKSPIGP